MDVRERQYTEAGVAVEEQVRERIPGDVYASELEFLKPSKDGRRRENAVNEGGGVVVTKVQ